MPKQTEKSGFPTSGDSNLSTSFDGDNQEDAPPKKLFITMTMRKKSLKREEAEAGTIKDLLMKIDKAVENDSTEKLLKYFKAEIERARQHELKLFNMLFGQQYQAAATLTGLQN